MPTQALEHLSEETLEAYSRRSLSTEERSAVQDHLADCEDCRLRFRRRLYATDDTKAEAGKRLVNLLYAVREESLREEQSLDERVAAVPEPTFLQRISAALTLPRLGYASAVLALAALGIVALTVWRWQSSRDAVQPDDVAQTVPVALPTPAATSQQLNGNTQPSDANKQAPAVASPTPPFATAEGAVEAANNNNRQQVADAGGRDNGNDSQKRGTQARRQTALRGGLNDAGSVIGLDDAGRVAGLESAPPSLRETARHALSGDVEVPDEVISDLRGNISDMTRSGTSAGAAERRVVLLEPLAKVVRTGRPTFKWEPFEGSKYYLVKVVNDDFILIEQSDKLTEPRWTPTRPLASGVRYYWWQVEAYVEGKEVPVISSSKIKVLDPAKEREIKTAETQYPNSHLLLGSLYAQAGLVDEAEREFQLLLKANPKSPVARRLLKSVQERMQPRPSK